MAKRLTSLVLVGSVLAIAACSGTASQSQESGPAATMSAPTAPVSKSEPSKAPAQEAEISAARGEHVARSNACTACHSVTGDISVGPTWKGLYGSQQLLTDGTTVVIDEAFLVESVKSPDAKVAEGFSPGIMPRDFGQKLTDTDIASLVEYIKSLR